MGKEELAVIRKKKLAGMGKELADVGKDELAGVGEDEIADDCQMRASKRSEGDELTTRGFGETEWHGMKQFASSVAYSESSANWMANPESNAYSVAYSKNSRYSSKI
ncbi:hypothetical protein OsJ_13702 [Oryza sativa Japonica Group]|uniref:Uncharacterized protein n=1 Tax=Oryza sativa subsp. japonica TaxID=39947 RepID=A3AQP6_ORYSJ|nr:hypothetical protein OsJ_13702 [Oryza sativa Japonica Group]